MFFNVFIKFVKTSLEKSENTLEDFKDLHRLFPIVFSWPSVLQSCLQFYWFRLFFRLMMFVDVNITCKLGYYRLYHIRYCMHSTSLTVSVKAHFTPFSFANNLCLFPTSEIVFLFTLPSAISIQCLLSRRQ